MGELLKKCGHSSRMYGVCPVCASTKNKYLRQVKKVKNNKVFPMKYGPVVDEHYFVYSVDADEDEHDIQMLRLSERRLKTDGFLDPMYGRK